MYVFPKAILESPELLVINTKVLGYLYPRHSVVDDLWSTHPQILAEINTFLFNKKNHKHTIFHQIFMVVNLFHRNLFLNWRTVYCTALHCTSTHCTALYCTAVHCPALHCTALHCTSLHWTAYFSLHTAERRLYTAECGFWPTIYFQKSLGIFCCIFICRNCNSEITLR